MEGKAKVLSMVECNLVVVEVKVRRPVGLEQPK